ncbi:hypothetical protein HYH02_006573 [Chlamydomonas schloesseri]|uniref:LisH domain-containing protein n=1 Tax=Chlamydomonas schloesseri TaxID=2026947 RepID=A0A835W4H6_9CHLO|nr:hypothetical protein HYH02_006573 [Chlamydomonas schloesseri]|eukprot:KAG2439045.1 hypothetical protein HYH02_006573 [Chlamydomonas schloesseri]
MVESAKRELESGKASDPEATLSQLHKAIEDAGLLKELNSSTKEFHTSIAKLGKALEKAFDMDADICRALRPAPLPPAAAAADPAAAAAAAAAAAELRGGGDPALLARVVAEHFYREGRFSLGDALAAEAGLMDAEALRAPYADMHTVLEQIRARNLEPALQWAVAHRQQLASLAPPGAAAAAAAGGAGAGSGGADGGVGPSSFEFRLHALNFINTLQTKGRAAALAYAKAHFGPHAARGHMPDIQRLMGCLLFASASSSASCAAAAAAASSGACGGGIAGGGEQQEPGGPLLHPSYNPYVDLLSPGAWDAAAREFSKQACSLMGQASESPLTTVVAAGSAALPTLLKLAAVMEKGGQDLRAVDQLPVEIGLGPEFVFRPIFACPVSRDMSTPDNPPLALPCGHVLAEQSVAKLLKNRSRAFKCPYCPAECRQEALRPVTFPGID